MSLADMHKFLIGRMGPEGNETEVQELANAMATTLHALYPDDIGSPESYLATRNGAKYQGTAPPSVAVTTTAETRITELGHTQLTEGAVTLFRMMNIDDTQSAADQLAEFRSRLTYLAFPEEPQRGGGYLHRMIREVEHLSVVAAFHVNYQLSDLSPAFAGRLQALVADLKGYAKAVDGSGRTSLLLSLDLKQYHKLFNDLSKATWAFEEGELMHSLADKLHAAFPLPIRTGDEYFGSVAP